MNKIYIFGGVLLLLALVGAAGTWYWLSQAKEPPPLTPIEQARKGVKSLVAAIDSYNFQEDQFPPTLKALTKTLPKGNAAILKEADLIDPWGRPYQYNRDNLHPRTERPEIWSLGPDPKKSKGKISSWDGEPGTGKGTGKK